MNRLTGILGVAMLGSVALAADAHAERQWTEVKIVTEGGFLPWNYTKPDGKLAGFEIDLAHDLCRRMNVKCTISAQAFDGMIPALNAGKFDAIIDDVAITPKRERAIAFSVPYAALCYTFATLKGSDVAARLPPSDAVIALAGTSVSFADTYLKGTVLTRQYKTPDARDLDLVAGRVDAIGGSKDALLSIASRPGSQDVVLAGPCFEGGVVGKGAGVGLRKQDIELKGMFDKAIRGAQADGTIKRLSEPVFHMDVTLH